jgi:hypothetical protein
LGTPKLIRDFPKKLNELVQNQKKEAPAGFGEVVSQLISLRDTRIQDWFDELKTDEARYLVLTLSLVNSPDMRQETFWAIYERLTEQPWRTRQQQLKMHDYLQIRQEIDNTYINIVNEFDWISQEHVTRIRFADPRDGQAIITHALNGYRRSLVRALRILADIITEAGRLDGADRDVPMRALTDLDIWGQDLAPSSELEQHRSALRKRLIDSIVQIRAYEKSTVENLLLAWAQGINLEELPAYLSENERKRRAAQIALQARRAFTETVLRIYTFEPTSEDNSVSKPWYQKHSAFRLLHRWYKSYAYPVAEKDEIDIFFSLVRGEANDDTLQSDIRQLFKRDRLYQVRTALVHLLYGFAQKHIEIFTQNSDGASHLLKAVPTAKPVAEELTSMWHMLVALAWNEAIEVRQAVAERLGILLSQDYFPMANQYFFPLFALLASDWNSNVRISVANVLTDISDDFRITFINYLLDLPTAPVSRQPTDPKHYLYRQSYLAKQGDLDPDHAHLWTGILAMFMLGIRQPDQLKLLLHTRLTSTSTPIYRAYINIARFIANNLLDSDGKSIDDYEMRRFKPVLQLILNDRTGNNQQSAAAETMRQQIMEVDPSPNKDFLLNMILRN